MSNVDQSMHNPENVVVTEMNALHARIAELEGQIQTNPEPTTTNFSVKPPKPNAYGGRRGEDIDGWLFQLEQYLDICRIADDGTRVQLAAAFFKDHAAIWWRNHISSARALGNDRITKWDELKKALVAQFKPVNASKLARDRLANLRQTQSVQTYVYAFRSIILEIPNITDDEKLDRFIRGLKPNVREKVEIENPSTMDEAASLAERIDTITYRQRTPAYHPIIRTPPTTNDNGAIPMELDFIQGRSILTDAERARLRRVGGCFYCRELGHMSRDCPRKKRQAIIAEVTTTDLESENSSTQ